MRLTLQKHVTGHTIIIRCNGRVVSGDEIRILQVEVDDAISEKKSVVLHLADVNFIDSAGLGFLVRNFIRLRNDGRGLKLCQPSPIVLKALQMTNLHAVIPVYASEKQAVEARGHYHEWNDELGTSPKRIVCLDDSFNVQAYLNALLTHAGYEVFSARHVSDAKTLMDATRPDVLILGPATEDSLIERFQHDAPNLHVVKLPADFALEDPTQSGAELVQRLHVLLAG